MSKEQWGHGFYQGRLAAQKQLLTDEEFPIGMFFFTWEDNKIKNSGFVIGSKGSTYLARYFSWLDGTLLEEAHPFNIEDTKNWTWYATDKDMRFARYRFENWSNEDVATAEMLANL